MKDLDLSELVVKCNNSNGESDYVAATRMGIITLPILVYIIKDPYTRIELNIEDL